jgi:O-antigen/teichoic acid export membrane protein
VRFVIGDEWRFATGAIAIFGVTAGLDQLGFNWASFCRALDRTRPLAVLGLLGLFTFVPLTLPLILVWGLNGFMVGWLLWELCQLTGRSYYLKQIFPGFRPLRHAARAFVPSLPAVAVVLAVRQVESGHRTAAMAVGELLLYAVVTVAATVFFERPLLREAVGYLRRRRG